MTGSSGGFGCCPVLGELSSSGPLGAGLSTVRFDCVTCEACSSAVCSLCVRQILRSGLFGAMLPDQMQRRQTPRAPAGLT